MISENGKSAPLPSLLLPSARTHLDASNTKLWAPSNVDPDEMGHSLEDPPVASRRSEIRGLYQASYASVIPSPNTSSRGGRAIRVGIFHTAETGDVNGENGSALNVARYFATKEAKSSSHAIGDSDRLIRGVPCALAAWTCRGANSHSVQIELATRAKRTRAQWMDDPGMLEVAAQWCAAEGDEHNIPFVVLSPADYNAGKRGWMQHKTYTDATGDGTHWDCGPSFPIQMVVDRAAQISRSAASGNAVTPATPTGPVTKPTTPTSTEDDYEMQLFFTYPSVDQKTMRAFHGNGQTFVEIASWDELKQRIWFLRDHLGQKVEYVTDGLGGRKTVTGNDWQRIAEDIFAQPPVQSPSNYGVDVTPRGK